MAHNYYEPTEYEQMLIAAGWVDIESLDEDYIDYESRTTDALGYDDWKSLRQEWDSLDAIYLGMISGVGVVAYSETERQLVSRMAQIETQLGY